MMTRPFFFWSKTTTLENRTSRSSSKSGSSQRVSTTCISFIDKSLRVSSSFSSSRSRLICPFAIITLLFLTLCNTVAHSFHCLPTTTTCSQVLKTRSNIRQASLLAVQRPRGLYIPTTGLSFVSSTAGAVASSTTTVVPSFCRVRGGAASSSSSSTSTTVLYSTTTEEETNSIIMAKISTASSMTPAAKLDALRARMKELNLDVYLVPSDDPHLSEYTPDAYKRRAYLTGFQGSAGTAVVTESQALLWTDSRYWNEATLQLDMDHWTLQKAGQASTPTITSWLADLAKTKHSNENKYGTSNQPPPPLRVGIDPFVHAASFAKELDDAFAAAAKDLGLNDQEGDNNDDKARKLLLGTLDTSAPEGNLIDAIWESDAINPRPALPASPFRVHPMEYAGWSVETKVEKIRKEMREGEKTKGATLAVFCTLDDVAYLLNMRAKGDVDTCPVGIAYATVSLDEVTLYCDPAKVASPEIQQHLKDVTIKPYDVIVPDIQAHCSGNKNGSSKKVWLDTKRANYALSSVIPEKCLLDAQNAITPMKACKNNAELEGMRRAHIVDGAAMAKFMSWLEETIVNEGRAVSEVEIDEKLTACRAAQPGFLEVSFPTIAGVGANGAIVHYRAAQGNDLLKYLDTTNSILIDSGGQYEFGTTDVTRTWHFGKAPDPEFVDMYTRVLKGNIGLDMMIFPENTPGFVLDVYARRWLWDAGKDYGHGTGHGVGAALNVHEGPMSISPRWANKEVLKKGMIVSNEPGYYEDGHFGVRIENLLEIKYVKDEDNVEEDNTVNGGAKVTPEKKKFLKFSKLTMIPIQKNLIDIDLMTNEELNWLDTYHNEVFEKISPLLEAGSPAMAWLKKSCEKIDRKGR